jgi:hypothetical protein
MRPLAAITMTLVVFATSPARAERASLEFGRVRVSLDLPPGFSRKDCAKGGPGMNVCGFTTEARPDGTRALIQISVIDLDVATEGHPDESNPTLDDLATSMIGSIRRRRMQDWKEQARSAKLGTIASRRIEWSGSIMVPPGGTMKPGRVEMRGVLYVALWNRFGIALATQDFRPMADQVVPLADRSLLSFVIARGDRPD